MYAGLRLGWPSSNFSTGEKNENFTMTPTGNFALFSLSLRNPPVEIGEIDGMVSRVVLTNAFSSVPVIKQNTAITTADTLWALSTICLAAQRLNVIVLLSRPTIVISFNRDRRTDEQIKTSLPSRHVHSKCNTVRALWNGSRVCCLSVCPASDLEN